MFGRVRAESVEHSIVLAQGLLDQALMLSQQRFIVPAHLANELLQRPHLPLSMQTCSQQAQSYRFDILAGHVRGEQPTRVVRAYRRREQSAGGRRPVPRPGESPLLGPSPHREQVAQPR